LKLILPCTLCTG